MFLSLGSLHSTFAYVHASPLEEAPISVPAQFLQVCCLKCVVRGRRESVLHPAFQPLVVFLNPYPTGHLTAEEWQAKSPPALPLGASSPVLPPLGPALLCLPRGDAGHTLQSAGDGQGQLIRGGLTTWLGPLGDILCAEWSGSKCLSMATPMLWAGGRPMGGMSSFLLPGCSCLN